jgi:hypothetical protein
MVNAMVRDSTNTIMKTTSKEIGQATASMVVGLCTCPQATYTMGNGWKDLRAVQESIYLPILTDMRVNSRIVKGRVVEHTSGPMAVTTKVCGWTIRCTAWVSTLVARAKK